MVFHQRPLEVTTNHVVAALPVARTVETFEAASAVASGGVASAAAVPHGSSTVRLLLLLCALVFLGIAIRYATRNESGLAVGHGLAGVGLVTAAVAGDGAGVWVGVTLAGSGVVLLFRDARRRGRRSRPSF